ncbi:MAG: glutamate synthase subunit alpha, partial [Bacteroidota bacterium]
MDPRSARPATLYRPGFEHDNCGVGLVCRLDDEPTHAVVHDGLRLLNRLAHRGGVGADAASGDGAGVLTKLPHRFLADAAGAEGIVLPRAGQYGLGMLFLASEATDRAAEQQQFEQAAKASGFRVLGWRLVPTCPGQIGETARAGMPSVWQVFAERTDSSDLAAGQLERALYLLRRR